MNNQNSTLTPNYSKLIGTPYSEKDCYGIVVEFYRQILGIELTNYYESVPSDRDTAKKLIYSSIGDFTKVEDTDLKFGDLILIKLFGVESHIAVYLGDSKMLHSTLHSGCVIEGTHRWKHLIVGYYRVVKNDTAS